MRLWWCYIILQAGIQLCYRIEILSINNADIIWFKIKKDFTCSDDDQYFALCYIPPDNSTL